MPRYIGITDSKHRDAQVQMEGAKSAPRRHFTDSDGERVRSWRLVKATEGHDYPSLRERYPDAEELAQALVDGDPEVDRENIGRKTGPTDRVWIKPDGKILYSAQVLKAVYDPHGDELSREDFVDVEASVDDETALPWTGRLLPRDDVVRKFALVRKIQLRHINGLTFDFLREIAQQLEDAGQMLFVGAGRAGSQPLIFQRNGSPYRGFLEGRVSATGGFKLVLHLSNLELKPIPPKDEPEEAS